MKFLLDASIGSPVAEGLREAGFDAKHVREKGLQKERDDRVIESALSEQRTIVTHDYRLPNHFRQNKAPSIIKFVSISDPADQLGILVRNADSIEPNLARVCLAVFFAEPKRVLYLWLPLGKGLPQPHA